MSKSDPDIFTYFVIELLNIQCPKKNRLKRHIIDSSDMNLNLNWNAKKITKKNLEDRIQTGGFSS